MMLKNYLKYPALVIGLTGYVFSGIDWNIGILAWIAPVFVLYFTKNARWFDFLLFFVGMAASAAISRTAENLSGLFIVTIITGLFYGVWNLLPYLAERLLQNRKNRFYNTLIFPSAVILFEYLFSQLYGIWGNQSVTQYYNLTLIQIASVFGIFSISFLIAWFASVINWIISNAFEKKFELRGPAIYAIVLIAVLLFGGIRISISPVHSKSVKVGAIVSDTDIHEIFKSWEDEILELSKNYDKQIPAEVYSAYEEIESQIEKTKEALENGAKIVVWNEISLILKQAQKDSLIRQIRMQCIENDAYVLLAFLEENSSQLKKPFNNKSVLVTSDGEIGWEYMKSRLHPMEELISNRGDFSLPFVDTEYGRISNVICSDLDYPKLISGIGKNNIDIMLVPAYDWVEITPYHSNMATFAAIQFGVPIMRSNGKGIIASFDYLGDETLKANTLISDSEIYYSTIAVNSTTTLYSIIGDVIVYVAILFLLLISGLKIKTGARG